MNKIFKVIWNEARNAYVVVSEIAKNHGSKSCSTKKLLAMLIATGVMTCASFDVLAEKPVAATTAAQQYVALKAADFPATGPSWRDKDTWGGLGTYIDARDEWKAQQDGKKQIGKYTYTYDGTNKYWVRKGYVLTVDENGGKYTQLSQKDVRADVAYTGTGVPEGILQSVTSTVEYNGVVTHSGDSLQKVTAGSYAGVSNSGGTGVVGSWNYIIKDSSWEGSVDAENHQDGYVDLIGNKMPKGFITTGSGLEWDEAKQTYTYQGKAVDYRNMYVIDGKLGVFTNANGSEVYTGTVYGKNNEILMTVKDNGKFYSYWAASVTDPSATMETYPVSKYNSDLAVIDQNIKDLNKDIIKEVTLTKGDDSAIIRLVRNGGNAVDGAITVTSGGGTGGNDTFVKISNAADAEGKTFATGSKVEAIGSKDATTGIKINGEDYTIKSGSKVSVTQNADKKTTTITVDDKATTITDTDTTYTEGDGIEISDANAISVSKNLTGMQSIKGAGGTINLAGSAITVNETTFNKDGRIQNVANGTETKDAVNFGQLQETNNKVDNLTTEVGKGWTVATENGTATKVGAGDTVKFIGDDNIVVSNTGKNVVVKLGKDLTGLTSVTTENAYVTKVDESKNESVTNVGYVNNQIADAALSAGNGISITDKKINVKLKDGEQNLVVNKDGLSMNTTLNGIQSITGAGTGAGSISFEGSNVKVNQNTFNSDGRIQGVVAGKDDTDAVNVGQLNKVVAAGDTDVHIKAGEYKVDDKNKVAMNLVDKAGNDEGTVTITGVAKAEDVAVVYDKNKTSLRSTNATLQTSSKEEEAVDSIALGKDASAVKESVAIGNGASVVEGSNGLGGVALGYKAHAGYKGTSLGSNAISGREGTTLVGANTNSGSLYTTVVGTDSVINSDGTSYEAFGRSINVQGATATVVGSKNTVDNKNGKVYSGVANNVMGSANTVEGSNGVTIQGTGNKVTDAYKDMNIGAFEAYNISKGDYSALAKKKSGAIAVVGGANTVSKQTDSTVIGYDNKLTGDNEKGSHDVFMAGSHNELTNVSDSIVMGNKNVITGVSNVISFGHQNEITANNAVAIGNGAGVSAEGGVALGVGSVASTAANALGYGAAEGETGIAWKATNGAVSVGSSVEGKKITRQITNVAAGTEDTDAVNVAQLKKVSDTANAGWNLATNGFGTEATNVKPGDYVDFSGDKNISVSHDGTNVKVELNDELKDIKSIIGAGEGAGSISFADGGIKLNNKVTINKDGKITGVAAGEVSSTSTDAVNGSQLHAVATEAGKHTTLSNGKNTTVESTVKDGQTDYKVNVAGDLTDITSVANGDSKINLNKDSIIISNGNKYFAITNSGIGMSYIGADYSAKSIMLGENGTTISGGLNVAGSKITGVAEGEADTDAVNVSQLQKVSDTANAGWNLATNGVATKATNVKPGDYVDFSGDDNIKVSHDGTNVKVELNDELKDIKSIIGAGEGAGSISFADGGIKLNNKVTINKDGKITGVAAGEVSSTSTDAVNGSQLHAVATEAGKHTTLSNGKNTTVESTVKDGQTDYKVNVAGDLTDITSVANGDSKINLNKDSIIISNGNKYFAITNSGIGMSYIGADYSAKSIMLGENGTTISGGLNVAGSKITGVAEGVADTDAVNVGQLKEAVQAGNTDTHIKPGEYGVGADNKVNMDVVDKNGNKVDTVTIKDVAKASDVGNVNDIADDLKNGGEGKTTVVEAVNNLNNKLDTKVGDLQYSKVGKGDIADGDSTTTAIGKLDQKLTDVAATAAKHTKVEGSSNIIVTNTAQEGEAANYEVKLNKDIDVDTVKANSVTTGQTVMDKYGLKVGDKVSVSATAVTAGKTSISDEGVKVGDKTYISADGLNANNNKITNVVDGTVEKDSKDAINGGQLHQAKADINNRIDGVENQVISNSNRIGQLSSRVNKVGAGAAALAALHPMDFDPDDKLTFSAGYGNYGGENAAAIGAY